MSTSGIAASSSLLQSTTADKVSQRNKYSQDLASNIESGNLTGAQTAFAQLLQGNLNSGQTNSKVTNDFKSLESAFKTNDLTSVKSAFATLQRDTQASDPSLAASLKPSNLSLAQQAFASLESLMRSTGTGYSSQKNNSASSSLTSYTV